MRSIDQPASTTPGAARPAVAAEPVPGRAAEAGGVSLNPHVRLGLAATALVGAIALAWASGATPAAMASGAVAVVPWILETVVYTVIPFLVLIFTLVSIHELGHYAAARIVGLKVLDFSLGFGRAVLQVPGRHNTWTLRLLPLGGYVRVSEDGPGGLAEAGAARRIAFTAAGPAVNLAVAFLFYVVAFSNGLTFIPSVVHDVVAGGPAERAGIHAGDRIVAINGFSVRTFDDIMVGSLYGDPNQTDAVTVTRAASHSTQTLTVPVAKDNRSYGIRFKREQAQGLTDAIGMTLAQMNAAAWSMINLPLSVSARGGDPISLFSGPVGIAHFTGDVVRSPNAGMVGLQFIALLNLGLAVINLLPLPIFDGGRILIYAVEAALHRRTPVRLQNFLAGSSLGIIVAFGTLVTAKDIIELWAG